MYERCRILVKTFSRDRMHRGSATAWTRAKTAVAKSAEHTCHTKYLIMSRNNPWQSNFEHENYVLRSDLSLHKIGMIYHLRRSIPARSNSGISPKHEALVLHPLEALPVAVEVSLPGVAILIPIRVVQVIAIQVRRL